MESPPPPTLRVSSHPLSFQLPHPHCHRRRYGAAVAVGRRRAGPGRAGRRPANYTWFAQWCKKGRKHILKVNLSVCKRWEKLALLPKKFTSEVSKQQFYENFIAISWGKDVSPNFYKNFCFLDLIAVAACSSIRTQALELCVFNQYREADIRTSHVCYSF